MRSGKNRFLNDPTLAKKDRFSPLDCPEREASHTFDPARTLPEDGASGALGEARAPKLHAQIYGLTPKRTSGFIKKQVGQTAGKQ